jgi:hypothetical protein
VAGVSRDKKVIKARATILWHIERLRRLIASKVTLDLKARKGANMYRVLGELALFRATHNIAYMCVPYSLIVTLSTPMHSCVHIELWAECGCNLWAGLSL